MLNSFYEARWFPPWHLPQIFELIPLHLKNRQEAQTGTQLIPTPVGDSLEEGHSLLAKHPMERALGIYVCFGASGNAIIFIYDLLGGLACGVLEGWKQGR